MLTVLYRRDRGLYCGGGRAAGWRWVSGVKYTSVENLASGVQAPLLRFTTGPHYSSHSRMLIMPSKLDHTVLFYISYCKPQQMVLTRKHKMNWKQKVHFKNKSSFLILFINHGFLLAKDLSFHTV